MDGDATLVSIGKNAHVSPHSILGYRFKDSKEPTTIGDDAIIHSGVIVYSDCVIGHHFTAGHHAVIRANCRIGNYVVILHGSILEGTIEIGSGVKIMANVYIPSQTKIGDMVFIGPGVILLNALLPMRKEGLAGITIEDHVVIGGGVTLVPGITIGRNSFIGAGAVVTKNVPPNSLVYGNPGEIKPLPDKFGKYNDPPQIFKGRDLWHNQNDNSWLDEEFPDKDVWLKETNKPEKHENDI